MSTFLTWAEEKLNQMDQLTVQALNNAPLPELNDNTDKGQQIKELHNYLLKLRSDLRTVRNQCELQIREIQDKYSNQKEELEQKSQDLQDMLEILREEYDSLKRQAQSTEEKLARVTEMHNKLLSTADSNQYRASEYDDFDSSEVELAVIRDKSLSLKELLKGERLKTQVAERVCVELREKHQVEQEKAVQTLEGLRKELEQARAGIQATKHQIEHLNAKGKQSQEAQNMIILSETLQEKQRIIENLLTERASLAIQLENARSEKMLTVSNGKSGRIPLSSLCGNSAAKKIGEWVDEGMSEVQEALEEVPIARFGMIIYFIVIHLLIALILCSGGGTEIQYQQLN